ncbi:MAG: UDP-glucose 4-epimerase GalE [Ignavibacteria bacterium]|nr:UDP-glucose 4-epimerase GalE [Ignavibacteria bacterium]
MKVAVTGGAGYIGSHFIRELVKNNDDIFVIDNLIRGHKESLPRKVNFIEMNINNNNGIFPLFCKEKFDAVVHFAAFAYVGESVEDPGLYYENNVIGSINLIKAAADAGIKKFIFSSTCSLYGNPETVPITEKESIKPLNPYAKTKHIIENVLQDFEKSAGINYVALRYFNAAGAHISGEIGESHQPEPHLIPLVLQTALGKRDQIYIFGDDYKTADGTCIRDYIHVTDLAKAHLLALNYLNSGKKSEIINLGTGSGYSVKEIIRISEKVTGRKIKYSVAPRREGDPAILVADNSYAQKILGWKPEFNLEQIISTAWKWHQNPKY